jgi:hypothetical protein
MKIQLGLLTIQQKAKIRKELSLVKMMGSITVLFVFCYIPTIITSLVGKYVGVSSYVYLIVTITLWLSPACNWIIYGMRNRAFRQAFKHLLSCNCGVAVHPEVNIAVNVVNLHVLAKR